MCIRDSLNTAAFDRCGANKAAQDAGLVFGGGNPTNIASTEEYNAYYTTGSFGRVEADDVQIAQNSQLVVTSSLQLPVFTSTQESYQVLPVRCGLTPQRENLTLRWM